MKNDNTQSLKFALRARVRATLCAAGVACALTPGIARAGALFYYDEAVAADELTAQPGPASSPAALSPPAPTPAAVEVRLNALSRALPQEPNPVQYPLPGTTEGRAADELGLALALLIFGGAILLGALAALYLGLLRWLWDEDEPRAPAELHLR